MVIWLRSLFVWIQKYERHLSAPVFIAGFINDVFLTYGRLALNDAIFVLAMYVLIAGIATIVAHYLYVRRGTEGWKRRGLRVVLALLAQFVSGGLLSGCLIFYTRDAALTASWPFILIVVIVFLGNEFFRHYREALVFRSVLFFFTTYIYVIFAFPSAVHQLGGQVFLESTLITLSIFALYILGLTAAGRTRLKGSLLQILTIVAGLTATITFCYFTGAIPPLPLALKDAGVYANISHVDDEYTLQGEEDTTPWWDIIGITPQTVHETHTESLYVYSSIFAPTKFSAGVIHQWQKYNAINHRWSTIATVPFPINGGRDGGYRGYSEVSSIGPGTYRVNISTLSKQVIGRLYFNVIQSSSTPKLVTETE